MPTVPARPRPAGCAAGHRDRITPPEAAVITAIVLTLAALATVHQPTPAGLTLLTAAAATRLGSPSRLGVAITRAPRAGGTSSTRTSRPGASRRARTGRTATGRSDNSRPRAPRPGTNRPARRSRGHR